MNNKYKKQTRVAMAVALAATSIGHSTTSIFAQSEDTIKEEVPVQVTEESIKEDTPIQATEEKAEEVVESVVKEELESKESIQHVEKAVGDVEIDATNFPDSTFRSYISINFDTDNDGILSSEEIDNITSIDVSSNSNITSVQGIEHFPNLTYLDCTRTGITSIDVSKNTKLEDLRIFYNPGLTSLDVSKNIELAVLLCGGTNITSIDVSNNTKLVRLDCWETQITNVDVTKNNVLEHLDCGGTQITSLDLSNNPELTNLLCGRTNITTLDVSNNTKLTRLDCWETQITNIDVTKNNVLEHLDCNRTQITSLDITKNPMLNYLNCNVTGITNLDVSKNTELRSLFCSGVQITSIDVSNNPILETLSVWDTNITSLDVSKNPKLQYLSFEGSRVTSIDVSNNPELTDLHCGATGITNLDLSNNPALTTLKCHDTGLTSLDITKNTQLIWVYVGDNLNLDVIKSNSTIDLGVIGETFNITEKYLFENSPSFNTIDRIQNINGATLDKSTGVVSGYTYGSPITYTYNCGTGKNGPVTLHVSLIVKGSSSISIDEDLSKIYDGTAVVEPNVTKTGSNGTVSYEWYTAEGTQLQAAPTDAGDYKVKAILADDGSYAEAEVEKEFTITKASSTITINDDLNKVYDGTAVAEPQVSVTGSTGTVSTGAVSFEWYTANDMQLQTAPTEAGDYKVKAILADDANHIGAEVVQEFTITKASSTITIDDDLNKAYDGQPVVEPSVTTTGSKGTVSFEWYTVDGIKLQVAPVDAGSYVVKAILVEDTNYDSIEVEKEFTISQVSSSIIINDDLNKVYDGQAVVEPTDIVTTGSTGTVAFEWYTADGNLLPSAPVNAGSYILKAILADDTNHIGAEVEKEFIISQASSSVTITVELDKVYDGQAVSEPQVSVTGSTGAITYEWYKKEESATRSVTWTQLTEAPREVGSYKVVVTVAGDENFEAVAVEKEFSILASEESEVVPTPGEGEGTTTIPGQEVTGVQTGDGTQVGLWTMLVGLSAGMMMFFRRKNRKEEV